MENLIKIAAFLAVVIFILILFLRRWGKKRKAFEASIFSLYNQYKDSPTINSMYTHTIKHGAKSALNHLSSLMPDYISRLYPYSLFKQDLDEYFRLIYEADGNWRKFAQIFVEMLKTYNGSAKALKILGNETPETVWLKIKNFPPCASHAIEYLILNYTSPDKEEVVKSFMSSIETIEDLCNEFPIIGEKCEICSLKRY